MWNTFFIGGGTLKYLIDLGYNSLSTSTICFYCSVVRIDQKLDKDVVLKYYATNNTISTALRLYWSRPEEACLQRKEEDRDSCPVERHNVFYTSMNMSRSLDVVLL